MSVSRSYAWWRVGLVSLFFFGMFLMSRTQAAELAINEANQQVLDQGRVNVQQVQAQLTAHSLDDAGLANLRNLLAQTHEQMVSLANQLEPQAAALQARLNELGEDNTDSNQIDALRSQRQQLQSTYAELDAQIKQARLLTVESDQALAQVSQQRRALFQERLGTRSQSILSVRFWQNVQRDWPQDWGKARYLLGELGTAVRQVSLLGALLALMGGACVVAGLVWGMRRLPAFAITHTKPSRLRRSVRAAGLVLLYALAPGLLAAVFDVLLRSSANVSDSLLSFLQQIVWAAYLAGLVAGLGVVLLAPSRPSWRLPPIPSSLASRLRFLPYLLAILLSLTWLTQQFLSLINAALSTTLLLNSFNVLCLSVLIGFSAWTLDRGLARLDLVKQGTANRSIPSWLSVLPWALWLSVGVSVLALLLGYNALSSSIVQEILWLGLILSSVYVVLALLRDGADSVLAWMSQRLAAQHWTTSQWRTRSQVLLLLTGALRICFLVLATTLVLVPFGEYPGEWLQNRLGFLFVGFDIGQLHIKPSGLALAFLTLLLGVGIVRLLQKWMAERFLPVTSLDPGMRSSTANLFSYVGYFVVFALVLSTLGIGLDRMAWIISALSVGIGFGLQAVVQNFVSGLILLAERPIKVGDWVSVNGVEGNVRKINARATEIEMFDRSTLIVPNSEFITKAVRNVTLTNPLGLVKVTITMPVNTDARIVRKIMLEVMQEQVEVLKEPAASVSLDGFDSNNGLVFSASCYVPSPRQASAVRSTIMFGILEKMAHHQLVLHPTQTMSLQRSEPIEPSAVASKATDATENTQGKV